MVGGAYRMRRMRDARSRGGFVVNACADELDVWLLRAAWLAVLAGIALLSCTTSRSSEQHLEAVTAIDSKTHSEEHKTASGEVKDGPWTETVYEFAPATNGLVDSNHRAGLPAGSKLAPATSPGIEPGQTPSLSTPGPLVKVTVRDYQGRDTTWQAHSDGLAGAETHADAKVNAEAQSSKTTRRGPPWWVLLLVGAGVAGVAYVAWKFKPPFLGFLWRLLP